MDIQPIQTAVRQENIFFTDHALRQMIKRAITDIEVQETILSGEIIEEYPQDKYSPGCLRGCLELFRISATFLP